MTRRMIIMLGCVLALVAALGLGFYLHIRQVIADSPKPSPQTVSAVKVEALDWQPQLSAVGTLSAVRGVDLSSEIAGLVREVKFKSGQDVKAGDLLIQLNADADIAQLHALEAAAELAVLVLQRDKAQLAAQAVSQAQVDGDLADLKGKRALAAQQAATVAKKTIRAPFSGRLGISTVNPGQFLNPGDKIVTLQAVAPIYIDFFLPQRQIAGISVGMAVNVTSDAYPGQRFAGRITAVSPKIDAATRNVQVQATIENAKRRLLPGMFARAVVDSGDKQRYLTLPQTAITYNPYGSTVFVIEPGVKLTVKQVFVTTGPTRGDQVAILSGVSEGQQIVTSGQIKLKNGTEVVINNSVQPLNNPNPTPQEE